jgi:hypothetical protein
MKRTPMPPRKTPLKATTIRASKRRPARPMMTPARKNAKGQPCTLRFPGCYPGPENEQVQLCHLRMLGGGGTGLKPHDSEAVFGCTHCHDLLDGRRRLVPELAHEFTWERILRALIETWRLQREAGVLFFKGEQE